MSLAFRVASRGLPELPPERLREWLEGATELARDASGPSALRARGGFVVKLFHAPGLLSSQAWRPLSRRFVDAARGLTRRGFATVAPEGPWVERAARVHVVTYPWIEGTTLRAACEGPGRDAALGELARLLGRLHAQGVLFRSLHFANVLVREGGGLALVDVADVRFRARPLSEPERLRNARHLGRYREDLEALRAFGSAPFAGLVAEAGGVTASGFRDELARVLDGLRPTRSSCPDPQARMQGAAEDRGPWQGPRSPTTEA